MGRDQYGNPVPDEFQYARAEERRAAWITFAAAALRDSDTPEAADEADRMLDELDKRDKRKFRPPALGDKDRYAVADALYLSTRAANCLANAGISSFEDLVDLRASDLLKIENFGRGCLKEVREALAKKGLALRRNHRWGG